MASKQVSSNGFRSLSSYCNSEMWEMSARNIQESPHRLESTFYGSEGYGALDAMKTSSFVLEKISDRASVQWFGPFARRYVQDSRHGIPFLSSSDMMEARPRSFNLISIKNSKNLDRYIVREDTLLVSCSGTIGNVALVTADLTGFAVSQHAIRVVVKEQVDLGPTYCFLQSVLGQFLVKRSMSGSVIQSIYEKDVADLPIPRLPRKLREELTARIGEASALRVEANRLLDEAEDEISKLLGQPKFTDSEQQTCAIKLSKLVDNKDYKGSLRLDAYPHTPARDELVNSIERLPHAKLRSVVKEIIYIGKVYRVPVDDPKYGVPLLNGKDLGRIRPSGETLLAVLNSGHIKRCRVSTGTILVSRSGNIGRVSVVHRNFEGFVASEDILRVVPDSDKLDGYYAASFLSSSWGQVQIQGLVYGSVVLHMSKEQLGSVEVPVPSDKGVAIGKLFRLAYDKRADATSLEDGAIALFTNVLAQGRHVTETHWGRDY